MGLYLDARRVLVYVRDNFGSVAPGSVESIANKIKKLDSDGVREAFDLAVDLEFFTPPKAQGEFYVLNSKGKRFLQKFLYLPSGVYKQYSNDNPWLTGLFSGILGTVMILILKWFITGNL